MKPFHHGTLSLIGERPLLGIRPGKYPWELGGTGSGVCVGGRVRGGGREVSILEILFGF